MSTNPKNIKELLLSLEPGTINLICSIIINCTEPQKLQSNAYWSFLTELNLPNLAQITESLKTMSKSLGEELRTKIPLNDNQNVDFASVLRDLSAQNSPTAALSKKPSSHISSAETEPSSDQSKVTSTPSDLKAFQSNDSDCVLTQSSDTADKIEITEIPVAPEANGKDSTPSNAPAEANPSHSSEPSPSQSGHSAPSEEAKGDTNHGETVANLVAKFAPMNNAYICKLPFTMNEEDLEKEFSHCGEIVSSRIIRDEEKRSKGYGFLNFATPSSLSKALEMDKTTIRGLRVRVSKSEHCGKKVFVGNIDAAVKYRAFVPFLFSRGTVPASVCIKSGYAFVVYDSLKAASHAVGRLRGAEFQGTEISAEISKQSDVRENDRMVLSPSRTLYLRNIPSGITEKRLLKIFEKYGRIKDSHVSEPREGTRRSYKTSFAFVSFDKIEDAVAAHNAEMDRDLDGNVLRIEYSSDHRKRARPDDRADHHRSAKRQRFHSPPARRDYGGRGGFSRGDAEYPPSDWAHRRERRDDFHRREQRRPDFGRLDARAAYGPPRGDRPQRMDGYGRREWPAARAPREDLSFGRERRGGWTAPRGGMRRPPQGGYGHYVPQSEFYRREEVHARRREPARDEYDGPLAKRASGFANGGFPPGQERSVPPQAARYGANSGRPTEENKGRGTNDGMLYYVDVAENERNEN